MPAWFQNIESAEYKIVRILKFCTYLCFHTLISEFHLKINNHRICHLIAYKTIIFFLYAI